MTDTQLSRLKRIPFCHQRSSQLPPRFILVTLLWSKDLVQIHGKLDSYEQSAGCEISRAGSNGLAV